MLVLPHLREGPLLARARALRQPVLVAANAFSRWSRRSGVREWAGWSTGQLRNAWGLHGLSLDSAGFSAMVAYGGYPWTIDDYLDLAAAYPRSEEHTSELQSLMRISYAVFCLNKQKSEARTTAYTESLTHITSIKHVS